MDFNLIMIWENIKSFPREIKWFIQRGRRGWSDRDIWSFDLYLCKIIEGGLNDLAKNNHGCPSEYFDENKKDNECWKWEIQLELISNGFKEYREKVLENGLVHELYNNRDIKLEDHTVKTTPEITKEEHEKLEKDIKEVEDRFKITFKLFQKNFSGLWD